MRIWLHALRVEDGVQIDGRLMGSLVIEGLAKRPDAVRHFERVYRWTGMTGLAPDEIHHYRDVGDVLEVGTVIDGVYTA